MVKGIVLTYYVILISCCCANESLYSKIQQHRYRNIERNKCRFDQESCNDGECISDFLFCDGKYDCRDRSDETQDCKRFRCPRYLYTCKYGACINADKVCDSRIDCADRSDEENCVSVQSPIFITCERNQFRCDNGDCVYDTDICDGVAHCPDGSDETPEVCQDLKCWPFLFQCDYGACINEQQRCNGISNCVDDSDEAYCSSDHERTTEFAYSTTKIVQESENCRLPEHPENGKWSFLNDITYIPGELLSGATTIFVRCNHGYKIYPQEYAVRSICQDSAELNQPMPKCLKTCASFEARPGFITIKCDLNGVEVSCKNPYENTRVTITFSPFYRHTSNKIQHNLSCIDGSWENSVPLPTIINLYVGTKGDAKVLGPQEVLTYYLLNNTNSNITAFIINSDEDNLYPIIK